MPHYYFQMIKRSKGHKNKLEGRMRPAGLTLAMSAIYHPMALLRPQATGKSNT